MVSGCMYKISLSVFPLLLAFSVIQIHGAEHVGFTKDVLPILQRHCFECHGPDVQEGGLRFDDRTEFLAGGYSGPAIISGKPSASELLRRVSLDRLHDDAMPPVGPGISGREEIILRRWIQQGGELPDTIPQQKHWAYVVQFGSLHRRLAYRTQRLLIRPLMVGSWRHIRIKPFSLLQLQKKVG